LSSRTSIDLSFLTREDIIDHPYLIATDFYVKSVRFHDPGNIAHTSKNVNHDKISYVRALTQEIGSKEAVTKHVEDKDLEQFRQN